jgi:broad specificity phosphatase PhoE
MKQARREFSVVSGYFANYAQLAQSYPRGKIETQPNFGLEISWNQFQHEVSAMNLKCDPTTKTVFKVLFLTRHGLGVHNVVEKKVGRSAWDVREPFPFPPGTRANRPLPAQDHWGRLDGDGKVTWADAKLVEEGEKQVNELSLTWKKHIQDCGLPVPSTLYTSPLARCLQTTEGVFHDLFAKADRPFRPVVKELLRERMINHTCNRRSSRSWIAEHYQTYIIEDGFTEEDELWRADRREPMEEHVARTREVLEDIFESDPGTFISLTVHSFAITAILRVLGTNKIRVREGSTVAFLVRAEMVDFQEER